MYAFTYQVPTSVSIQGFSETRAPLVFIRPSHVRHFCFARKNSMAPPHHLLIYISIPMKFINLIRLFFLLSYVVYFSLST